jgi:hypothetical protein
LQQQQKTDKKGAGSWIIFSFLYPCLCMIF